MFNMDDSYAPPDAPTRFALVVTQAHQGRLGQGAFPIPVPAGQVLAIATMGYTNVAAGQGPQYRHPQAGAAWIEHATAQPMDVLPMKEVIPLVAQAQVRGAAVQAFWAKAKQDALLPPAPPAPISPTDDAAVQEVAGALGVDVAQLSNALVAAANAAPKTRPGLIGRTWSKITGKQGATP